MATGATSNIVNALAGQGLLTTLNDRETAKTVIEQELSKMMEGKKDLPLEQTIYRIGA